MTAIQSDLIEDYVMQDIKKDTFQNHSRSVIIIEKEEATTGQELNNSSFVTEPGGNIGKEDTLKNHSNITIKDISIEKDEVVKIKQEFNNISVVTEQDVKNEQFQNSSSINMITEMTTKKEEATTNKEFNNISFGTEPGVTLVTFAIEEKENFKNNEVTMITETIENSTSNPQLTNKTVLAKKETSCSELLWEWQRYRCRIDKN